MLFTPWTVPLDPEWITYSYKNDVSGSGFQLIEGFEEDLEKNDYCIWKEIRKGDKVCM